MVRLKIDGRECEAEEGATILDVCRKEGIFVPTICHHDAVEPVGACRLCMVEIGAESWGDWTGLFASCLYPAKDGLIVKTKTEEVDLLRKTALDLLLSQAPAAEPIQKMAREYGIEQTSFPARDPDNKCILCGLCVRVCNRGGMSAITTFGRGADKKVGAPFGDAPPDCIGCAACAHICPTGHIEVSETKEARTIWNRSFEFLRCEKCKKPIITLRQRDFLVERKGLADDYFQLCDVCKRQPVAQRFVSVGR